MVGLNASKTLEGRTDFFIIPNGLKLYNPNLTYHTLTNCYIPITIVELAKKGLPGLRSPFCPLHGKDRHPQ